MTVSRSRVTKIERQLRRPEDMDAMFTKRRFASFLQWLTTNGIYKRHCPVPEELARMSLAVAYHRYGGMTVEQAESVDADLASPEARDLAAYFERDFSPEGNVGADVMGSALKGCHYLWEKLNRDTSPGSSTLSEGTNS